GALKGGPAGKRDAAPGAAPRALEPRADLVEIVALERDVPLRGTPVGDVLGAEVERGPAVDREPQPAARLEGVRLLHLHQPENPAVEGAHRVLAAPRHADLDVVEAGHRHHRAAGRNRGKLTSGVRSSNVTSTGMPMRVGSASYAATQDAPPPPNPHAPPRVGPRRRNPGLFRLAPPHDAKAAPAPPPPPPPGPP